MSDTQKSEVRSDFFAARKQLGDAGRATQSAVLCDVLWDWYWRLDAIQRSAAKVCATLAFGTEPDTDPLLHRLVAAGVEVWVPISHEDRTMSWVRWFPDAQLARSRVAPLNEPTGPQVSAADVADADVVLVPALTVDSAGFRLGKGGGYYDRFLAALPNLATQPPLLVTPVFDHEFVDAGKGLIPIESHDLPVQAVVTAASGMVWVE